MNNLFYPKMHHHVEFLNGGGAKRTDRRKEERKLQLSENNRPTSHSLYGTALSHIGEA